jgi:hypothetical protein
LGNRPESFFAALPDPETFICITPIDRSVSTGYELLLHIGSIYKELGHGSAITVSGDAPNCGLATDYQFPQIVTCFFRRDRVSAFTP